VTTPNNPIILRSSSSGFAWGELIHSHYKSSCLRWILIQSHIPFDIEKRYSHLGKLNEDRHQQLIEAEGFRFDREKEVEQETAIDGVVNRGHIDFVVYSSVPTVHELKHVQSPNVYREVIKKRNPITDNLAQCVNYMLHMKTQHGLLKYSYYKNQTDTEPTDEYGFKASIDDFGRVFVDAEPTKFTVQDLLAHQRQAADVLKRQVVAQRPYNGEVPYIGACHWCPMNAVCAQYDRGSIEGTEAFIDLAKQQSTKKEDDNG